jgi:hypothetical protein
MSDMNTLSCGCHVEDLDDGEPCVWKSISREGAPALEYGVMCKKCIPLLDAKFGDDMRKLENEFFQSSRILS